MNSTFILLSTGTIIRLWIGYRRFNRRGVGGLQHFSNYFIGLVTLFFEWVLKWIANAALIAGLFLLLVNSLL